MAFKMRSQSAVKKGGFKNMGSSPNKFLGRIARGLKNTRVGQAFGKVAGSGALGLGGMMASQMMGGGRQGMQGAGSAPAQGLSPHTHDDSGEATPLNKTKHNWKKQAKMKLGTKGAVKRGKFELGISRPDPKYVATDDFSQFGKKYKSPLDKKAKATAKAVKKKDITAAKEKGKYDHMEYVESDYKAGEQKKYIKDKKAVQKKEIKAAKTKYKTKKKEIRKVKVAEVKGKIKEKAQKFKEKAHETQDKIKAGVEKVKTKAKAKVTEVRGRRIEKGKEKYDKIIKEDSPRGKELRGHRLKKYRKEGGRDAKKEGLREIDFVAEGPKKDKGRIPRKVKKYIKSEN